MTGLLTAAGEFAVTVVVAFAFLFALAAVAIHAALILSALDEVRRMNVGPAYVAGAVAAFVGFCIRERLNPVQVYVLFVSSCIGLLTSGIVKGIAETTLSTSTATSGRNPPPVLAPLKKSELEMPTQVPSRLPRNVAPWPPFTGVRVELGGDQQ